MPFFIVLLTIIAGAIVVLFSSSAQAQTIDCSNSGVDGTDLGCSQTTTCSMCTCCERGIDYVCPSVGQATSPIVSDNPVLSWGAKVSAEFRAKTIDIAREIGVDPSWLMAIFAFESGKTFSSGVVNKSGSGAVGLIQFMPDTATKLGTTTSELSLMTPEEQLEEVLLYFQPYAGILGNLGDTYMAVLWPAAIGKSDDYVLFDKSNPNHPKRYLQNKGLDFNKDGKITKLEAYSNVALRLEEGLEYAA